MNEMCMVILFVFITNIEYECKSKKTQKRQLSPRKKEIKRNPARKKYNFIFSAVLQSVVCCKAMTHSLQAIFTTVNDNWQIACM
jgi:hypothetical protein